VRTAFRKREISHSRDAGARELSRSNRYFIMDIRMFVTLCLSLSLSLSLSLLAFPQDLKSEFNSPRRRVISREK